MHKILSFLALIDNSEQAKQAICHFTDASSTNGLTAHTYTHTHTVWEGKSQHSSLYHCSRLINISPKCWYIPVCCSITSFIPLFYRSPLTSRQVSLVNSGASAWPSIQPRIFTVQTSVMTIKSSSSLTDILRLAEVTCLLFHCQNYTDGRGDTENVFWVN